MSASNSLLDEIKRITGLTANESAIEATAVPLFEIGAIVHVFVLGGAIPLTVWSGVPNQDTPENRVRDAGRVKEDTGVGHRGVVRRQLRLVQNHGPANRRRQGPVRF